MILQKTLISTDLFYCGHTFKEILDSCSREISERAIEFSREKLKIVKVIVDGVKPAYFILSFSSSDNS